MATSQLRKVLVIDDEEAVIELIQTVLKMYQYETIATTQWTEAIDAIEHQHIDLMLLDLNMPTIDGQALIRFIREQGFDLPVIVVSGFIDSDICLELKPMGVRAFIDKPFEIHHLAQEVVKVLGQQTPIPQTETTPEPQTPIPPSSETQAHETIPESSAPSKNEMVIDNHSPGKLMPKRPPKRPPPPLNIPTPPFFNVRKDVKILFLIALVCILVAGFMVVVSQQDTSTPPASTGVIK